MGKLVIGLVAGMAAARAIQVCQGVYLATAHGSMDDPIKAGLGREY